jgi:glyoxalase/bleomycin resistance protein/dioxygenase superfamily protein
MFALRAEWGVSCRATATAVRDSATIRTAYEELKGKGVTFLQEPAERPYGIEALFRDDSGNWFSLNQHKRYGS